MVRTPVLVAFVFACLLVGPRAGHAGAESAAVSAAAAFHQLMQAPIASVLPGLKGLPAVRASANPEESLIAQLDNPNEAVRAQAAKSLRNYVTYSNRAESKLLEVIDRHRETDRVKREAIKSLAWAAQHYGTKDKLLGIARGERWSKDLRAIAFKTLYVVVSHQSDVRDAMQRALDNEREPEEIRGAAAWALFADTNDSNSRRALLEIAENERESAWLRLEAVKSLLSGMNDYEVRRAMEKLARDRDEDVSLREGAVLCFLWISQDWGAERLMEDLSREENPVIQAAAVEVQGKFMSLARAQYFHLGYYHGKYIDPLENQ